MQIKPYAVSKLPFSDLFKNYCQQQNKILKFFESPPFDDKALQERANDFQFLGNREVATEFLTDFNKKFGASAKSLHNINRLKESNSLVVVTGQQLTLYGGPLYTIYKTLSAIITAEKYEKLLNRPVIPVFWLADEDHDAEEISEIGLLNQDDLSSCKVNFEMSEIRSGELPLGDVIDSFRQCVNDRLFETDFSDDLWKLLDECYNSSRTVSESFGMLMMKLFGKHGLVLAGSNSDLVKNQVADVLVQSVKNQKEIYQSLSETTDQLENEGYHGQVHLTESNLFYITDNNHRAKLKVTDGTWSVEETGEQWTSDELIEKIKSHPNRFSPNVFLRPVLQDRLLPVISYVAGPGEVAYYAQMKGVYELFKQKMPQILPRFSATIVESAVDRIFDKLPFTLEEYHQRIEDLESQFIEKSDKPDIEAIFGEWKQKVNELTDQKKEVIGEIDPTLKNSAGKASAIYFTELDKLKGKIYRSLKQQEKTQIDRISKIKSNLYPGGNLQEREIAFIYFLNKYGLDLFDKLLNELKNEDSDTHKLIYL
ncbi:bacillithiol biosynthesis cysteine-adding enzyme BshC [Rhodohalobacter halophilus]|uniref:bacillithiol biosynthesis cysteine-adding enzyme BshC n=1 Tax=Rhodohalobacter halophilus TaxID=1812810 RepID=UPI00083FCE6B|nr:bacillithiol biosynthesis cysteine-adding enzyme BshC [Rhodohalobacter halophilus]